MPKNFPYDVFLSHNVNDKPRVRRLAERLKQAGLQVWFDEWNVRSGDIIALKVDEGLEQSRVLALCISPAALASNWVALERSTAVHRDPANASRRFIPILLGDCSLPDTLRRYKYVDFREDSEAAFAELLTTCQPEIVEALALARPEPQRFATTRLPDTSQLTFVARDEELALMDAAWRSENPLKRNVVCFVGQGGEGKTSLVVRWLTNNNYGQEIGAERYFDWSFYSQGTTDQPLASADAFFNAALRWFGEEIPERLVGWAKGERLASLIRETRTLLILDGLEPLQNPPGPLSGQLRDVALKALIVSLAQRNPGLCLLTTRTAIADIAHFQNTTVVNCDLVQLSARDGVTLLRNLDVRGPDDELRLAVAAFEGHALALTLLGNYLRSETEDHDIGRWREVPLLEEDAEEGGHARRVLRAYEKWLGPSSHTVAVLRLLGLFGRPAESKCLDVLRQKPAIPGLTDEIVLLPKAKWIRTINHLQALRLISRRDDAIDAHALVREYFALAIKTDLPNAWREAQSRLYEFLRNEVPQYPATFEQIRPLYHAISHGCAASRYVECLNDFYERICRTGEDFAARKLGAYSADLVALSGFFRRLWSDPIESLPATARAYLLNTASRRIPALGRLREACEPAILAMELDVHSGNLAEAARTASALCGYHALFGELSKAVQYGRRGVELADESGNPGQRIRRRASLGDALHQRGEFDEAIGLFKEAEQILCAAKGRNRRLKSFAGHQYCDLLISLKLLDEAESLSRAVVRMARKDGAPFETSVGLLDLCRIMLIRGEGRITTEFPEVTRILNEAGKFLMFASREDYYPRFLFVRASLSAATGHLSNALTDLSEAEAIATRSGMQLYIADANLLRAQIARTKSTLAEARAMVERFGYWRHREELEKAEQAALNWPQEENPSYSTSTSSR